MSALLAATPVIIILAAMLGLRLPAAIAGSVGLVAALVLAIVAFDFGARHPGVSAAFASGGALAEAAFTALTILWIIFPALCIHGLQLRTGAIDTLRLAMGRLSSDPRVVALLVAWFFALFMEGAAGFGTSVALAAPFLVSAGIGRVEAVTIALIGHSVGVSFGAVGTPILPQMAVTPFGGLELSAATGVYHALVGWVMPLVVIWMVNRSRTERPQGNIWALAVLAALLFFVPQFLISRYIGPELPTLGGALVGGAAFVLCLSRRNERARGVTSGMPAGVLRAAAPYLVLVALVLVTRLVPPVQERLRSLTLGFSLGPFAGSMQPLYHPGTVLFLSFLFGALWQRARVEHMRAAMRGAAGQLGAVTIALVTMLGLSRVMVHAGMIDTLARAAATSVGSMWPVVAPFVGVLGTFVTGSATASNILFTDFQYATATRLALSPLGILGAQGFGAAVGNIICPHNIIAAGATVGSTGEEGEVLRRTLGVCLLYAFFGGLLAFFVFT